MTHPESNLFPAHWLGKPYYSLDAWLKLRYGCKVYKIALDAGLTCPNRDGTLDTRGCIFCSAGGSGEFAAKGDSVSRQLQEGLSYFGSKQTGNRYIAYFQAFTNTYGPPAYLASLYEQALCLENVCAVSIATRPDCLSFEILETLEDLRRRYPDKEIWLELGLQTIHESSAAYIRRGYDLSVYQTAVNELKRRNFPVIVHVILGLPGETHRDMLETVDSVSRQGVFGIKLQLLHVLQGTDLASDYEKGRFETLSKEEYLDLLTQCIRRLSPEIVIHRLTGDGPANQTISPRWSLNKRDVLNSLHRHLRETGAFQGQLFLSERNN